MLTLFHALCLQWLDSRLKSNKEIIFLVSALDCILLLAVLFTFIQIELFRYLQELFSNRFPVDVVYILLESLNSSIQKGHSHIQRDTC